MGFNRLAASMAPSVLPAPNIRWTSSTNKIILPSAFLHSSRTARSRSSNSPRYFAPATRLPMSNVRRATPLSDSGTSPSKILRASPSTIAVLPVPGSPTKQGLFFVRLLKICTMRRISSSRPITGSSFPSSAAFTKSMPYFSRASYVSSAEAVVTLRPPLISSTVFVTSLLVRPTSTKACRRLFPSADVSFPSIRERSKWSRATRASPLALAVVFARCMS
mmetsp:Transcript_20078/g.36442  ORF Transcript_20078/g.36442 Transcript_20078/m.36442 type:complete len:220 (-) Transcript_20078:313-972(-)